MFNYLHRESFPPAGGGWLWSVAEGRREERLNLIELGEGSRSIILLEEKFAWREILQQNRHELFLISLLTSAGCKDNGQSSERLIANCDALERGSDTAELLDTLANNLSAEEISQIWKEEQRILLGELNLLSARVANLTPSQQSP